ncbi:MAG: GNAT family N-acetyltransferase [Pseudorhizobium sp.]
MPPELAVSDSCSCEDETTLREKLASYNISRFGESDRRDLAIILRNDAGEAEGGLFGRTARGWLFIHTLFVPEHLRGQGLGGRLLCAAEQAARTRGCRGSCLDTMSPQARAFYRKHGYESLGQLEDLDGGNVVIWMKKHFHQL